MASLPRRGYFDFVVGFFLGAVIVAIFYGPRPEHVRHVIGLDLQAGDDHLMNALLLQSNETHPAATVMGGNSTFKSPRILCWVMTTEKNVKIRAIFVKKTWGARCDKLVFFTEKAIPSLPSIGVGGNVTGSYALSAKTFKCLRYIYEHYFDEADWFFKADDDTYVIMENMRYFLNDKNPDEAIYYGQAFRYHQWVPNGYFSGGAGYVMSKAALERIGLLSNHSKRCKPSTGVEDLEVGRCMHNLGVKVGDSRDEHGKTRFHVFPPYLHIYGPYPDWYKKYDMNGAKLGIDAISDYPITFHYVNYKDFMELEYFVYRLRPYGVYEKEYARLVRSKEKEHKPVARARLVRSKDKGHKSIARGRPVHSKVKGHKPAARSGVKGDTRRDQDSKMENDDDD